MSHTLEVLQKLEELDFAKGDSSALAHMHTGFWKADTFPNIPPEAIQSHQSYGAKNPCGNTTVTRKGSDPTAKDPDWNAGSFEDLYGHSQFHDRDTRLTIGPDYSSIGTKMRP